MQLEPASAEKKQRPQWFRPGQSGNPKGRQKGSRNKLAEDFVDDVYAAWKERGAEAINEMIDRNPGDFVKCVANILPQKIEITNRYANMSDDDLRAAITRTASALASVLGDRVPRVIDGSVEAGGENEAQSLQSIPEAEAVS